MAIPYKIKSFLPGRISINSEFLKYVDFSDEIITEFIINNYRAKHAKLNKRTGTLTVEYDPDSFDTKALFETLNNVTPELIFQSLSAIENGRGEKKETF